MQKRQRYGDWLEYLKWLDKYSFFNKKKDGILYLVSSFSTIILSFILLFNGLILFPILSIFLSLLKVIYFKYFLYEEFKNNSDDSSKFNYGLNIIFYFVAIIISTIFFFTYFIIIYFYQYYKLVNKTAQICFKIQFIIVSIEILFGTIFTIISQKFIEIFCRKYLLINDDEEDNDNNKRKNKVSIELSE